MAHYSRLSKVVIDVPPADHDRELAFWSAAAGPPLAQFDRHPEYHGAALHGQEFWLLIQRLVDGQPRVHIDIHTDHLAAEVIRLEKLGAARVQKVHSWQVMRDPAGLLFCVIPEPPGALNDSNAQRWADPVTPSSGAPTHPLVPRPICSRASWRPEAGAVSGHDELPRTGVRPLRSSGADRHPNYILAAYMTSGT